MYRDKIPANAEKINGKWWTPRMVMHYRGYKHSTFYNLLKKYTLKQLLYGDSIQGQLGKRAFIDKSMTFSIGGKEVSLAMMYYVMASQGYIDPQQQSYKQFANQCRGYATYTNNRANMLEGVDIHCQRYGCNIKRKFEEMDNSKWERLQSRYVDYITTERKKESYDWNPTNPNDRYLECIRADRNMRWYLYDELDREFPLLQERLERTQAELEKRSNEVIQLRDEISKLQQELINARRSNTHKQSTEENEDPLFFLDAGGESEGQGETNPR